MPIPATLLLHPTEHPYLTFFYTTFWTITYLHCSSLFPVFSLSPSKSFCWTQLSTWTLCRERCLSGCCVWLWLWSNSLQWKACHPDLLTKQHPINWRNTMLKKDLIFTHRADQQSKLYHLLAPFHQLPSSLSKTKCKIALDWYIYYDSISSSCQKASWIN